MKTFVIFSIIFAVSFAFSRGDDDARNGEVLFQKGVQNRISGGQISKLNEIPYQARIVLTKFKNGRFSKSLCGGTLISNKVIMTAAHCLDRAKSATINLGITKVRSRERTRVTLVAFKRNFRIHEKYNSTSMENDIGLILLRKPVKFNDGIQIAVLPPASLDLEHVNGLISGFGQAGTNATSSNELRFTYRKILASEECQEPYPAYFKPEMHVCVDGSDNRSICPGDSGGPLAIRQRRNEPKIVAGISSFGSVSCYSGHPTVFTRVTTYLSWIHKHTGISVRD